jgi:hypothetical protein
MVFAKQHVVGRGSMTLEVSALWYLVWVKQGYIRIIQMESYYGSNRVT